MMYRNLLALPVLALMLATLPACSERMSNPNKDPWTSAGRLQQERSRSAAAMDELHQRMQTIQRDR